MEDCDRLNIWLKTKITRVDAEKALLNKPTGTYLVRASVSKPGDYVISLIVDGRVEHHQIKHNHGRMTTLSGKELNNLHELLDHYKKHKDGLSVLLTHGVRTYDPKIHSYVNLKKGPEGYVNMANTTIPDPKPPAPYVNTDNVAPVKPPYVNTDRINTEAAHNGMFDSDYDEDDDEYSLPPPIKPKELSEFEVDPACISTIVEVGHGQFGQVFEAWLTPEVDGKSDHKGILVAVKTCKQTNSSDAANDFLAEARTLLQFNHPNVLGLRGVVTKKQPLLIVLDYMPYGDVRAALKACRSQNIGVFINEQLHIARQVAAGMQHLVDKNFVHRDLAARNVLLGKNCDVKIADFGLSRALDEESEYYKMISKSMLPMKWMSPEALTKRTFSFASDVFAYGVFMWEVFSLGKTPWKKFSGREVARKVASGERLECPRGCPDEVYALMKRCWDESPKRRPKFHELVILLGEEYDAWKKKNKQEPRDLGSFVEKQGAELGDLATRMSLPGSGLQFPREQLRFVQNLGSGEFGQVVQMELTCGIAGSKTMVAAKMLKEDASKETRDLFKREMDLLIEKKFQHKNVVSVLGVCTTEDPLMIIMEYVNLGDLHSYVLDLASIPNKPIRELLNISGQIAEGMEYLSSNGCVHRDLAARNCLVGSGPVVKISDFGLGRLLDESLYYKTAGGVLPVRWMAPESILFGKFTVLSDIYSFGVTLYEIFSFGKKPFDGMSNMEVANSVGDGGELKLTMPPCTPASVVSLQAQCCSSEPDRRPSFSELTKSLQALYMNTEKPGRRSSPQTQRSAAKKGLDVLHMGWLLKQGGGTSLFGSAKWRRRWFVLTSDDKLSYYKGEHRDAKALGMIDCHGIKKIKKVPAFDDSFQETCCFSISIEGRTYNLVSDTADARTEWFEILSRYAAAF